MNKYLSDSDLFKPYDTVPCLISYKKTTSRTWNDLKSINHKLKKLNKTSISSKQNNEIDSCSYYDLNNNFKSYYEKKVNEYKFIIAMNYEK